MTADDRQEPAWTLALRRRPASGSDGCRGDGSTEDYELICRDCGDDPRLGYREVPAGRRRVRGPYRLNAGIEAFLDHDQSHYPADPTARDTVCG